MRVKTEAHPKVCVDWLRRDAYQDAHRLTPKPLTSDSRCAASVSTARLWASTPPTTSTIMNTRHRPSASDSFHCTWRMRQNEVQCND